MYYGGTANNSAAVLVVNSGPNTIEVGFQNAVVAVSPVAITTNTTYHFVGTYDGTTLRMYVNGALVASAATVGAITLLSGSIGAQQGSSDWVSGVIDEPAIYNLALAPPNDLAHATPPTHPPSPLAP